MDDITTRLRGGLHKPEAIILAGVTHDQRCLIAADEIERLREALVIIANPLADFKRQAEKDGDHLSPLAISIANDPEYLKEVARTALKEGS